MAREPHRSTEILDAVALLVVDMQDAFLNVMPDREAVLRRTALAIEAARAFGIKVIFTEQVPAKLGPTHADLLSLAPDARVFPKNEFSALLAEGLSEYLRRINVYHLLLAGIETPICIYQTALHAQDNELDVTLLSDCTTGRRPDDCLVVLESLARAECHVLPAETVFYSMLGSSLNPRFAHFTRIVKRYAGEGPIDGSPTPAPEAESRPEGEERQGGQRHGGGRQGDRHQGGRQGDRHRPRHEPAAAKGESPSEADEPTDDLSAEDGISEAEANQPSYEEATAEHSEVESTPESSGAQEAPRARAQSKGEDEGDDDAPADGDSDDSETAADAEEGAQKKKRGRRRRGGARRRRARERAAGGADQPGTENAGGESASSGSSEAPAPSPAADAPSAD